MVKIHTHKEPYGWRSSLQYGDKFIAVDGFFEREDEAASAAALANIALKRR